MPQRLTAALHTLHLKTPFRIAHGTSTERHNLIVRFGEGLGEGALPPYYGYTAADILGYFETLDPYVFFQESPFALEAALRGMPPGPAPARAALDIALHDHWGKQLGHPLYRLWGLNPADAPPSTMTLSIPESEAELRATAHALRDWPILKLKLGTGTVAQDLAIVRAVAEETRADLLVDANGAWSVEEAAALVPHLATHRVVAIEQPIAQKPLAAWQKLRKSLPQDRPLLIADESVQSLSDIIALAGAADGINVKLAKAGGLHAARQWIAVARSVGLHIMLGCMIETPIAVTAAAHLAPLADFADLDGHTSLRDARFQGLHLTNGCIHLPDRPGLGVIERAAHP